VPTLSEFDAFPLSEAPTNDGDMNFRMPIWLVRIYSRRAWFFKAKKERSLIQDQTRQLKGLFPRCIQKAWKVWHQSFKVNSDWPQNEEPKSEMTSPKARFITSPPGMGSKSSARIPNFFKYTYLHNRKAKRQWNHICFLICS
jgi:hypothetical protein